MTLGLFAVAFFAVAFLVAVFVGAFGFAVATAFFAGAAAFVGALAFAVVTVFFATGFGVEGDVVRGDFGGATIEEPYREKTVCADNCER